MKAIIGLIIDILKDILGLKYHGKGGNGDNSSGDNGDNNGDGDKGNGDDNGNAGSDNKFIVVAKLNISDITGLENIDNDNYKVSNIYEQDPEIVKYNMIWAIYNNKK